MGEILKIFEALEEVLGKEKALKVAEAIEKLVEHKKSVLKDELKEELTKELATKYDLKLTEQSLRALIEQVRGEMHTELEQIKGELKADIVNVKSEILKWLIAMFIGLATFIVGLVFTLIKLLKG